MTMYTMLSTLKQDHCVITFDFFFIIVDEHLQNVSVYDNNLNSPSYETVDTGTEAAPPVIQETPEERAQRLQFLQEELIKVNMIDIYQNIKIRH